ncbi:Glucan endo-1,3-beta-glucosidase 1 [Senna tora]|uniref:Glucan endo-1,3-beta-glucosidase 1 n=1 Tax=Senna tora TaxID=362788 RepID=A0A834TRH8_9FABA|nr:Glucan endo-1,3-beta-glucosidase 1 [Senna tora]
MAGKRRGDDIEDLVVDGDFGDESGGGKVTTLRRIQEATVVVEDPIARSWLLVMLRMTRMLVPTRDLRSNFQDFLQDSPSIISHHLPYGGRSSPPETSMEEVDQVERSTKKVKRRSAKEMKDKDVVAGQPKGTSMTKTP